MKNHRTSSVKTVSASDFYNRVLENHPKIVCRGMTSGEVNQWMNGEMRRKKRVTFKEHSRNFIEVKDAR